MVLVIKKVKTTVPWICVIDVFNNEENIGTFYEKDLQKASRVAFRIEKVIKEKVIDYRLNGSVITIYSIVGLI